MVLCVDSGYTTVWTGCLETSSSPRELKTKLPLFKILTDLCRTVRTRLRCRRTTTLEAGQIAVRTQSPRQRGVSYAVCFLLIRRRRSLMSVLLFKRQRILLPPIKCRLRILHVCHILAQFLKMGLN